MRAEEYNYDVVRQFAVMTVIWGVVGMGVGVLIAAQLIWPELNFGMPWLSYGRLRPLHTNAVIFAFGGSALFATSYYVVQRTCQARLFGDRLAAFTAASVLETALVSLQTWRGVPSHFNVETAFDAWVTRGLAGGGVALVVMVGAMTIAAFRRAEWVPASMQLAVRAGFVALWGAMAVGGVMIARGMTLVAEGAADTAYRTGGFLKPAHAVLMHGILVLPALAWLSVRGRWSERQSLRIVTAAVSGYALAAVLVTIGSLSGLL